MNRALVTGADGFVGQYLAKELRTNGYMVLGFDLSKAQDVREYETVRVAFERFEPTHVFHLAAQAYVAEGTSDPRRVVDVNVLGTMNVLEAARHTGSHPKVLIAGTSEEYGYALQPGPTVTEESPLLPQTPYGASKAAASLLGLAYHRTYGLHVVVTRAYNHTGPRQQARYAVPAFAKRIVAFERGEADAVSHGNLDATRNYLDVRDVVSAYRLAIEQSPGVYNISADQDHTMEEIFKVLCDHSSKQVQAVQDSRLWRPSGSERWFPANSEKLRKLGWRPYISLHTTLSDVLDYWRQQP